MNKIVLIIISGLALNCFAANNHAVRAKNFGDSWPFHQTFGFIGCKDGNVFFTQGGNGIFHNQGTKDFYKLEQPHLEQTKKNLDFQLMVKDSLKTKKKGLKFLLKKNKTEYKIQDISANLAPLIDFGKQFCD